MLRERVDFIVRPSQLPDRDWTLAGWFSAPPAHADVLLILIHGATYTHAYWDMPYKPKVHSCVQWAYDRGIATLNIDRLGCGDSSCPPGKALTVPANAAAVSQIVAQIRRHGIKGMSFSKIVLVGHSLGSLTSAYAQGTDNCADGVVLTGILGANTNNLTAESAALIARGYHPARTDPHLADRAHLYDDDYHATSPESRVERYLRIPPAEPQMAQDDLRIPGTMTTGEMETAWLGFEGAKDMKGPVLVEVGEYDGIFYNPKTETNAQRSWDKAVRLSPPNFTTAPLFKDTSHNLAQHPNAHESYEVMLTWMRDNKLI
jgi:pimeloyl-ACP methyl ester carboxylesterase